MVDPYTGEQLGRQETDIGLVEITSVTAQMASAKLVSGPEDSIAAGDLLLRPMSARSAEEAVANTDTDDATVREKKISKDSDW